MVEKRFNQLGMPDIERFENYLPTAFSSELTLLQKVNKIIQDLIRNFELTNEMVDYLNNFVETFDENLYETVDDILNEWLKNDKLAKFIRDLINEEVIESRTDYLGKKYVNLKERLDSEKADIVEVTAQLAEKRSNNILITMNDVAQDIKEAMTGGSVAVVGINAVDSQNIKNKAINEGKTRYFKTTGRNLFNKYTVNFGYYVDWITGNLISSSGYNASDFIEIEPSEQYISNYSMRSIVFYDINKNFISSMENLQPGTVVTSVANAYYARVSLYSAQNNVDLFQFEKGVSRTAYDRHFYFDTNSIQKNSQDGATLKPNSIDESKLTFFRKSNKNIFNPYTITELSYVSPTTGIVDYNKDAPYLYNVSDYIEVTPSLVYICNKDIRSIAFYDINKNFVSGISITILGGTTITIPNNVAYMRVNILDTISLLSIQIEQSESITKFESYLQFNGFIPPKSITVDKLADGIIEAYYSVWKNKTFISLGDSITWQDGNVYSGTSNIARGYQTILKENLGFASYLNEGVSGAPVSNGTANGVGTNTTSKTVDYSTYDLCIIAGGTNDFKLNVPIGTKGEIGDTTFDTNTFYGAYRDMVEHILKTKPTIRICLFTPLQRDNGGYNGWTFVNAVGHKLIDYVNAIKEIGKMYGIPVCDMYSNSGFNKLTLNFYTIDGLHPNDVGYLRMGGYASKFIDSIGV